jgi:hypothetical protein
MAEEEPNVAFAFSPAQAVQGLLDYTKSKHSKIYKSAMREVCREPFECEADGLYQFLKDIQDRADKMGWSDGSLNITLEVTDDNKPVQEKLIDNYGTISLEQVVKSELQYINVSSSASWRPCLTVRRRGFPCGQNSIESATITCAAVWPS